MNAKWSVEKFLTLNGRELCEYMDPLLPCMSGVEVEHGDLFRLRRKLRTEHFADEFHIVYALLVIQKCDAALIIPEIAGYLVHRFDSVKSAASRIIANLEPGLARSDLREAIDRLARQRPLDRLLASVRRDFRQKFGDGTG